MQRNDATILVTGGAGFIGSHFIRHLLATYPDYKVINLDKLTYCGNLENVKDVEDNPRYTFIKGDIADAAIVNQTVGDRHVDAIVNFAAESHVDRSILEATAFLHTSVQGTHALLEAAKRHGVKKVVHISTDEVYGSAQEGSFTEKDALNPSSPYSAAKAAADLLVLSYYKTYGLPVVITRSSNNFGPFQYPEKVIPLFITNVLEGKKIPLYGDGLNLRDWIFVTDNCRGIDAVLQKGKSGGIYNIGGGHQTTNVDLTHSILELLGKDATSIEYVKDRLGHDRRYSVDCTKITQELGWQPIYGFDQSLKATVTWYQENKPWWQKLIT